MQLGFAGKRDICSWGMSAAGGNAAGETDTRGKCNRGVPTHGGHPAAVYRHTGCRQVYAAGVCQHTGYADTRNVSVVYGLDIAPSLACTTTLLTCTVHFYFGAWPEDLQIA